MLVWWRVDGTCLSCWLLGNMQASWAKACFGQSPVPYVDEDAVHILELEVSSKDAFIDSLLKHAYLNLPILGSWHFSIVLGDFVGPTQAFKPRRFADVCCTFPGAFWQEWGSPWAALVAESTTKLCSFREARGKLLLGQKLSKEHWK